MTNTPTVNTAPQSGANGFVNGPLVDTATWVAKALHAPNNPPAMHRLKSTLGLFAGLYVGRKLMDIIVGETPSGKVIERDSLPAPLQPLHGLMRYNHYSDDPHDRWLKVTDNMVPAMIGAVGAVSGSYNFFSSTMGTKGATSSREAIVEGAFKRSLDSGTLTLDAAIPKAELEMAKKLRILTAASAIPGSAAGTGMTPGNLGIWFGEPFLAGSGRETLKVPDAINGIFKTVGLDLNKYFAYVNGGGKSVTGFNSIGTLQPMIDHLAENRSIHPEKLDEMANTVLVGLFGDKGAEKVPALVDKLKALRLVDPASASQELKAVETIRTEMTKHLKGVGLHETLDSLGLNVADARLHNRGLVGKIAMWLGADKQVKPIEDLFRESEFKRTGRTPTNTGAASAVAGAGVAATVIKEPSAAAKFMAEGEFATHKKIGGGLLAGGLFAHGLYNVAKGIEKDENNERHLGKVALGAVEIIGGSWLGMQVARSAKLGQLSTGTVGVGA